MRRRLFFFGLPLAAAAAALFVLGASAPERTKQAGTSQNRAAGSTRVAVETIEKAPGSVTEPYPGTVTAAEQGSAAFTLGGRVVAVLVSSGSTVSAGEPMARLDDRPYRHALERARATEQRVDARLEQARSDLARVQQLGNAATEEELEQRRTAVAELQARQREARTAVAEARRTLEETILRAPYSGEVVRQLVERGEVVQPGTPLFRMSGTGELMEVELSVPERLFARVQQSAELPVRFPLSPDMGPVTARITASAEHDGGTGGLFQLTLSLGQDAAERGVRSGMRAEAALSLSLPAGSVVLDPAAVVGRPDGTPIVYVVDGDRVHAVPVSLHRVRDERLIATAAPGASDAALLAPGGRVVVAGQQAVVDGQTVEVAQR
jgi:RND family efflux transporter MFP subunit